VYLSRCHVWASSHHHQQVHQQICGGVRTLRFCLIRSQCCRCCWNRSCRLTKRSCLCQCWKSRRYLCRCWRSRRYRGQCWRNRSCRDQRKSTRLFRVQNRWCCRQRTRLYPECYHGRQCRRDRDRYHGCSLRSRCCLLDRCSDCRCRSLSLAVGSLISKWYIKLAK
jgi:hypothetical protein